MHHSYMEANRHQTPLLECNHHLSKLVAPTDAERVWSHTLISFNVIAQVFPQCFQCETTPVNTGKASVITHYFSCLIQLF